MKKQIIYLLVLSLVFCFASITSFADQEAIDEITYIQEKETAENVSEGVEPQWGSGNHTESNPGTHGFIAERGLIVLKNAKSQASTFYTTSYSSTIKTYSMKPDVDETTDVFAWHFYGENGLNYLGGSTTAYTKFRDHYIMLYHII